MKFTQEEFTDLLVMILVADFVISSVTEGTKYGSEFKELRNKICQKAYQDGFTDLIEYDEEIKEYFPTKAFHDEGAIMGFIYTYNNDNFWEELKYKYFDKLYDLKFGKRKRKGKMRVQCILEDHDMFEAVEDEVYKNRLKNFKLKGEKKWLKRKPRTVKEINKKKRKRKCKRNNARELYMIGC